MMTLLVSLVLPPLAVALILDWLRMSALPSIPIRSAIPLPLLVTEPRLRPSSRALLPR